MRASFLIWVSLIVVLMSVSTGCEEVLYTAEYKEGGSCIKFEDAMSYDEGLDQMVEDCLGEDGVEEGDGFYANVDEDIVVPEIPVNDDTVAIEVKVKAGKCKGAEGLITELVYSDTYAAYVGEACGFMIFGMPVDPVDAADEWEFAVVSDTDNSTAALSNVTFCFGEGITVIDPPEGEFEAYRVEED